MYKILHVPTSKFICVLTNMGTSEIFCFIFERDIKDFTPIWENNTEFLTRELAQEMLTQFKEKAERSGVTGLCYRDSIDNWQEIRVISLSEFDIIEI